MEINPNSSLPKYNKSSQKKKVSQARQTTSSSPSSSGLQKSAGLSSLQEELKAMPEVRPERVAEGRVLKDNPDYPTRKDLNDLGKLVIRTELGDREADE